MPIHIVSEYLAGALALDTFPIVIACIVSVIVLKQWSGGVDLMSRLDREADKADREEVDFGHTIQHKRPRDLHGTIVVVVGGFTSQGLLVCSQLSALGAQLILLTPTLRSSYVVQMVHLLRDGTANPLIYAEQCDVTSLASIEAFAAQWNLGEGTGGHMGGLGAGPAGGLSASTGVGGVSSLPSSASKQSRGNGQDSGGVAPRRVDSIVFMPLDTTRYTVGDAARCTGEDVECSHAEILGRFHLVNLLLPSLLLLPPNRDIRIVSLLSPWYAAGAPSFDVQNLEGLRSSTGRRRTGSPSSSPWTRSGRQSLLWLALSRELQRRIQLMTDADQRPRSKLPGIDDEGNVTGKATPTNVNLINVCAGFERGRDVLDYLLPSTGGAAGAKETQEDLQDDDDQEVAEASISSAQIAATPQLGDELKGLLDPRLKHRNVKRRARDTYEKAVNDGSTAILSQQLKDDIHSHPLSAQIAYVFRYAVVVVLWPVAWLWFKSPRRAAESVTWATIAPVYTGKSFEPELGGVAVVPGELHREGRIVRPSLPDALLPGASIDVLWQTMENRAKQALSIAS